MKAQQPMDHVVRAYKHRLSVAKYRAKPGNLARIHQRQREKYATDAAYRARANERALRAYAKKRQEAQSCFQQ